MSTIIDLINNNKLVSALITAAIIGTVRGGWKWYRDHRDRQKIYDFLLKSRLATDFSFRSTEAISSVTKISEKRVEELCSGHPKIKRNEKEKQSWRLIG